MNESGRWTGPTWTVRVLKGSRLLVSGRFSKGLHSPEPDRRCPWNILNQEKYCIYGVCFGAFCDQSIRYFLSRMVQNDKLRWELGRKTDGQKRIMGEVYKSFPRHAQLWQDWFQSSNISAHFAFQTLFEELTSKLSLGNFRSTWIYCCHKRRYNIGFVSESWDNMQLILCQFLFCKA